MFWQRKACQTVQMNDICGRYDFNEDMAETMEAK